MTTDNYVLLIGFINFMLIVKLNFENLQNFKYNTCIYV